MSNLHSSSIADTPSLTPAISRDGFSYQDGVFYAEGDSYRYTRADAAELYELLTYEPSPQILDDAGNPTKNQPKRHVDRKAEFYSAQMAHYGLKVLKTREAAKKNLLAAFTSSPDGRGLAIPRTILDLEQTLKREWNDADAARRAESGTLVRTNSKAKGKEKEIQSPNVAVPVAKSNSMTKEEMRAKIYSIPESRARSILVKVLDEEPAAETLLMSELSKQTALKTADTQLKPGVPAPPGPVIPASSSRRTKQTARKTTGAVPFHPYARPVTDEATTEASSPAPKPRTKQTGRRGGGQSVQDRTPEDPFVKLPESESTSKPRTKQTARRGGKTSGPSKAGQTTGTKRAGAVLPISEWAGEYDVECPELAGNWDSAEGTHMFNVYPSSESAHLWASFDFGIVEGVIRSAGKPPTKVKEEVPFIWRGRESGDSEHEMILGDGNEGVLTFLGDGRMKATMKGGCFGEWTVTGSFSSGSSSESLNLAQVKRAVREFKDEFRAYNHHNYEIERKERWGKVTWRSRPRDDAPLDSDTTTGGGGDSDMDMDGGEGGYYAYAY
ncbi:hypothetical protein NLJ89_g11147 [Agrocybe chaxingu]|uniref:Uncharacterized protein n=1 Tax=Agrocybe chaxingu TaxID=84603 RepID=A0A9W8JPU2_9AGAR|nr:hypothetical protein NLJ89_g11147 [Agrocybe chaxingu]